MNIEKIKTSDDASCALQGGNIAPEHQEILIGLISNSYDARWKHCART